MKVPFNKALVFVENDSRLSLKKRELLKNLNYLFEIAFEARSTYDVWWIHVNKIDRTKNLNALLKYKEYFETVGYATITTVVVSLYKLFEPGARKNITITKIIEKAKDDGYVNNDDMVVLNGIIKESHPIFKKIAILRSNLFAHRREAFTIRRIYDLAKITPDEIKKLTELSLEILNFIRLKLGKQTKRRFESFTTRDTYKLLKDLDFIMAKF